MSSAAEAVGALLGRVTNLGGPGVALLARAIVVLAAIALAILAYRTAVRVVDRLLRPLEGASDYSAKAQRARTLGPLMKNVARYTLSFVALVVLLREVGVDVQALLVSAGVLGLAVGLGAQSLIKDVITGFFILFEGLIGVGDVIEVGGHTGTVETIGLRVTTLRLQNGAQRVIPNGEITQFVNYNKGWARAVVDVSVSYETDVPRALAVLEEVGAHWARETGWALEPPEAEGIVRFGEGGLGLRLMVKLDAAHRVPAEADLRRRIKQAFEREGISFPHRVVYLQERTPP